MREPCPHCGSTLRHTSRIGCCSGCKRLFSSNSSFDQHRRNLICLDPAERGLVPKFDKRDLDVPVWTLAGTYDHAGES